MSKHNCMKGMNDCLLKHTSICRSVLGCGYHNNLDHHVYEYILHFTQIYVDQMVYIMHSCSDFSGYEG